MSITQEEYEKVTSKVLGESKKYEGDPCIGYNFDNIFEDLGFDYFGPYNGNDLNSCIKAFKKVKKSRQPVVVHLHTVKGKGYKLSEDDKFALDMQEVANILK